LQQIGPLRRRFSDAIVSIDLKGNIANWNRAVEDIFGNTAIALIQRRPRQDL